MDRPLRILHVLRAPVGGLYRHVVDLTREQNARGHLVGIIADSTAGGSEAEISLKALGASCALGLMRVPMSRHIGASDIDAIRHVSARAQECKIDVLHGHGAKGGAYARLAESDALRAYTPHGGSLHYNKRSLLGLIYLTLEKVLARRTQLYLFESEYSLATFRAKIGVPKATVRVVHNGVRPDELVEIKPDDDAKDIVFVGELRKLKGVSVLIDALSRTDKNAILFGDGPDAENFRNEVAKRGLSSRIDFGGAKPAREAFRHGHLLIVPSLAESFPYIVLEAAAAAVPMIATNVGGIPEIFGPDAGELIPPGSPGTLAAVITGKLKRDSAHLAERLRERVAASFTVSSMADGVLRAYHEALVLRPKPKS